jgi:tetratricopeptide (TPR) repeat protein
MATVCRSRVVTAAADARASSSRPSGPTRAAATSTAGSPVRRARATTSATAVASHQQNGDPAAAVAAFERAIQTAQEAGDLRIVALARTRLARVLRALGRTGGARAEVRQAQRWYGTAGGDDGALLADHLGAALDDDEAALQRVLAAADPEIRVLTLDALGHLTAREGRTSEAAALLGEADRLYPSVAYLVTGEDRIDRHRAAAILAAT